MSSGKTISLAKARADFGTLLRLAERFGMVKIMHGSRVVGVFTSGTRWREDREWEVKEAQRAAFAMLHLPAPEIDNDALPIAPKSIKKKPGQ